MMDFKSALAETSPICDQARAAIFFRGQEAGVENLDCLFAAMKRIDTSRNDLNRHEIMLAGLGAMAIASTLNDAGIDPLSFRYAEMTNWILSNTNSPNTEVSGGCINSLGEFKNHCQVAVSALSEVIHSERRADENEKITLRGIAFRMLARIAPELAVTKIGTDACKEYLAAIELWSTESSNYKERLEKEIAWIHANQKLHPSDQAP